MKECRTLSLSLCTYELECLAVVGGEGVAVEQEVARAAQLLLVQVTEPWRRLIIWTNESRTLC